MGPDTGGGKSQALPEEGVVLAARILGLGGAAEVGGMGQQVPLLTALTGCQSLLKSRAHLRSSVGRQMGPGLIFLDSVRLGG